MAKKMLRSHHLAILALVLALGVATPIVVATLSEDEAARAADESGSETSGKSAEADDSVTDTTDTPADTAATATIATYEDLTAALADAEKTTLTLGADIELSEPLTIARDLTLDLNAHKITVAEGVKSALIIRQGNVMLTGGEGSSITIGAGVAIWVYGSDNAAASNYTRLTVDSSVMVAASSTDDSSYGLAVNRFDASHNVAYGVEVDFNGKLSAYNGLTILGHIQHSDNAPVMKIGDGAIIDAEGADDSMALYGAGYGVWTVGAAELTGSSALGVKAGQFTFSDTVMTANGDNQSANTENGGIAGSGAVFQIENNSVYAGGIDITIDGGEYTSMNGHVFYEYGDASRATSALQNLTINSGTFKAGEDGEIFSGVNTAAVTLAGGSYNQEIPADYLSDDQELVEKDGVWTLESVSSGNQPGITTPDPDDDQDKPEQKPNNKPQTKPSGSTPSTGVHNITNHISAIATTTSAVIAGVLVFCALILRRLIHRRPDKTKSASAKTSREATNSRTKVTGKTPAKSTKALKTAKSSAKSARTSATKVSKSAKSTKSAPAAKATSKSASKTVKTAKSTKARK